MANQMLGAQVLRVRGGQRLVGEIEVLGAKNTLPKLLVASLLTDEPCTLRNVADVRDVRLMIEIIRQLGGRVEFVPNGSIIIKNAGVRRHYTRRLPQFEEESRVTPLLCGPLLHRFKKTFIIFPGGCPLGSRTIDFHLTALQKFGVHVNETGEGIELTAKRLDACRYTLPKPSVGATEQVLLVAARIPAETVLDGAAVEPEVFDLVNALRQMGVEVIHDPPRTLRIRGKRELAGFDFSAMTDRSEVVSWACAALATDGEILVRNARMEDIEHFVPVFEACGGRSELWRDGIRFSRAGVLMSPNTVVTRPHPGFRTDWQPPLVAALTAAKGITMVHETVFTDRFNYLEMLRKFGADCELLNEHPPASDCPACKQQMRHVAAIRGKAKLVAAKVLIEDIRGGFACLICALIAQGVSMLLQSRHLAKGYDRLYEKLAMLGADIQVLDCHSPRPAGIKSEDWLQLVERSLSSSIPQGETLHRRVKVVRPNFDQRSYDNYYDAMMKASTIYEKGQSLEQLAVYMLECLPAIGSIDRRVNSESGEFDIVCENFHYGGVWSLLSGVLVVECKNENKPVAAGDIHKFVAKLETLSLRGGIVFTRRKTTSDAASNIRLHRARGVKEVVVDGSDLAAIRDGASLENTLRAAVSNWLFR